MNISALTELSKGDAIKVQWSTTADASYTISNGAGYTYMSIMAMPDFSVFGVNGIYEYLDAAITADTATVTANTWADVSGASLTLTPGTWIIGYEGDVQIDDNSGGANSIAGNLRITDSGGTELDETICVFGSNTGIANQTLFFGISKKVEVVLTETTTYKLQIRCTKSAASAVARALSTVSNGCTTIFADRRK